METINFDLTPSVISRYMLELRDVEIQRDPMRFRTNLERIGEMMAYEVSKRLDYEEKAVTTPLGTALCYTPEHQPVIGTILRAGLPFHQGFLRVFDHADNAFVSAYRRYREGSDEEFDVVAEYMASPSIEGRTLILVDPMLATGASMELGYRALLQRGCPAHVHICSVIASQQAVDYLDARLSDDNVTLWVGAIDPEINSHSYIVPGLGDAGDLAYGEKL